MFTGNEECVRVRKLSYYCCLMFPDSKGAVHTHIIQYTHTVHGIARENAVCKALPSTYSMTHTHIHTAVDKFVNKERNKQSKDGA